MPGETELHKTLKKEACRWLFKMGYRCIAAEVRLKPLGIIDAVGTGLFRPYQNYLGLQRELQQVCFVECKATRADFLRDHSHDGQMELALTERKRNMKVQRRYPERLHRPVLKQALGLGKFKACLMQPMANLHYILAPAGVVQKKDLPPRWGLLTYGPGGVNVVVRCDWQECCRAAHVEGAIARTLTGDIYRADDRAISSVNREIFAQQQSLAGKIRQLRPQIVLAPLPGEAEEDADVVPLTEEEMRQARGATEG
ncbi:MAG TPA: hypothetical protein VEA69_11135 [Tepidisphaeraceae bacterium]|nr:hypothetical protein [Tepidisphaeraceae bacterium]